MQSHEGRGAYKSIVAGTKIGSVVNGEPTHTSAIGGAPVGMLGEGAVDSHAVPLVGADELGDILRDMLRPDHATVLLINGSEWAVRDDNLALDHDAAVSDLSDTARDLSVAKLILIAGPVSYLMTEEIASFEQGTASGE